MINRGNNNIKQMVCFALFFFLSCLSSSESLNKKCRKQTGICAAVIQSTRHWWIVQELQGMQHRNHRVELGLPAQPGRATCLEMAFAPTIYIFYIQGIADPFQGWEGEPILSSSAVHDAHIQCLISPTAAHIHHEEEGMLNVFYCCGFLPFLRW